MIGRPTDDKPTVLSIVIQPEITAPDSGEEGEGDNLGSTPEQPPLSPQSITFASRLPDVPWIAFEARSRSLPYSEQTILSLENVGSEFDGSIPLRIEDGLPDVAIKTLPEFSDVVSLNLDNYNLLLSITDSNRFDQIELLATNSFGEGIELNIQIEENYFKSDQPLADKETSLSHLYKIQADEIFLRGALACADYGEELGCDFRALARDRYERAAASLRDCGAPGSLTGAPKTNPCLDENLSATLDLLRVDIAYRLALIEYELPFYGGYSALTPTTPHHEWVKMEALLEDMTALMERIDRLRQRYADQSVTQALIAAEMKHALGEYDASVIDQEIAQNEVAYASLDLSDYLSRERELEREITEFQSRMDSLSRQQDALASQAAALTQSLLASAAGVPISDVNALASGDLQSLAESFVQQQLLSSDAPLAKDLLASSELARGVAETVGDVREIVEQVEDFQNKAQIIESAVNGDRDAIRKLVDQIGNDEASALLAQAEELEVQIERAVALSKSLDRNRALEFLQSQLSPEQNAEIDRIVEQVKPIEEVFETAYVAVMEGNFEQTLKNEFEQALSRALDAARPTSDEIDRIRSELKSLYSTSPEQLTSPYFGWQAMAALDTLSNGSKDIVSSITALDAEFVMSQPALRPMIDRLSPSQRQQMQKALESARDSFSSNINMSGDELCITVEDDRGCVDFKELRRAFRERYQEAAVFSADRMNKFLSDQVDNLSRDGVLLLYLAKDGAAGFSGNLRQVFDNNNRLDEAWDEIAFDGPLFSKPEVQAAPRVAVARVLTASAMPAPAQSLPKLDQPSQPRTSLPDPTEGGPDPATNAIIQGALNYALPGAGAALQLGQAWASMDANRDLQNDYMQSLSSAVREQDQLARAKRLATRAAALGDLRRQRADAVSRAGAQGIAQFEVALSSSMDEKQFNRELINLYRPQFYFIAEQLRERFEAFDRSLADWTDGVPEAGFFQQQILADPGNARLALDSEIQLFGWLNRNIEATRTSPYALHHHWERVIGLVSNYCSNSGCKPGDGSLGQIAQTPPQLLFQDLQGKVAHRDFRTWLEDNGRTDTFVQFFSFAPGQLGLPPSALNARILDFAIIPVDSRGKPVAGSRVQLRHDGFSTLRLRDPEYTGQITEVRHVLLPREMPPANREQSEDVEALRQRFQGQSSVADLNRLRDLEGYGLFGGYRLEVIDGPGIEQVDDFRIQISYIYTNPQNINSEADFVTRLEDLKCASDGEENGRVLTGVLCHSDALVEYRQLEFDENGKESCSELMMSVKLTYQEQADFFRSLGNMECLTIKEAEDRNSEGTTSDTPFDPQSLDLLADIGRIEERGTCSAEEVLLIASRSDLQAQLACFGDDR